MAITDKQRGNSEGRERAQANLKPFQPGQSGNPKGRPKGVTLSDALRRMLAEAAPGRSEQTYAEAIARALCKQAAKGNVLAAREIADRTEGKPKQAVDMTVWDWREMAKSYGFTEEDVYREAKRLIESVSDSSDD